MAERGFDPSRRDYGELYDNPEEGIVDHDVVDYREDYKKALRKYLETSATRFEDERKQANAEEITRKVFNVTLATFLENLPEYIEEFRKATKEMLTSGSGISETYMAVVSIMRIMEESSFGDELKRNPAYQVYLETKKAVSEKLDREEYKRTLERVNKYKKHWKY